MFVRRCIPGGAIYSVAQRREQSEAKYGKKMMQERTRRTDRGTGLVEQNDDVNYEVRDDAVRRDVRGCAAC